MKSLFINSTSQQRQKTCPPSYVSLDNDNEHLIHILRLERDRLIQRLQYESAIFLSDKIIAINGMNINDGFILVHCIYLSKQYQRAAHLIQHNNLHEMDVKCCCLLVKCLVNNHHSLLLLYNFLTFFFDHHHLFTFLIIIDENQKL